MYLTDRQLLERLPDFNFTTEEDAPEFDADKQIGPCSIDLRLSLIYWSPKRSRRRPQVIDLEQTRLMELSPHRGWERHRLRLGEKLTLKPGQMVLGRVSESFSLPSDCAGAIEGRSSYVRLGLSVHTAGGFINPGWRGHMPLTLVNHSPNTLRIPVGAPLCQLMVIPLSNPPAADYAARTDRKYFNDIGGPSYWWRDHLMKEIRDAVSRTRLPSNVFDELDEMFMTWDDEDMLLRLEAFLSASGHGEFGSADELLDEFAKAEDRRNARSNQFGFAAQWSWALFTTVAAGALFVSLPGWLKGALVLVALVSIVVALRSIGLPTYEYLTTKQLASLRAKRDQVPAG